MWSREQQTRLAIERATLETYFPAFHWYHPTDPSKTHVEGPVNTNSGRAYRLKIFVPPTYPWTCPDMTVSHPAFLTNFRGRPLTEVSASMHTLGSIDGQTKICHFMPSRWTPSNTLYLVSIKGRIWLEAYECHLRTGRSLDVFLRHMTESSGDETNFAPIPENSEEEMFLRLLRQLLR